MPPSLVPYLRQECLRSEGAEVRKSNTRMEPELTPEIPAEPAAKLWELLRRNDSFREQFMRLDGLNRIANAGIRPDGTASKRANVARNRGASLIDNLDAQNLFAADALRWLVPEPIFRQRKIRIERGTQRTLETAVHRWSTTTADPRLKRFADPNATGKRKYHWKRLPISGRSYLWKGEPTRWGPEVELVTSDDPKLAAACHDELAEWRDYFAEGRRFTVDTTWSEAPPGFQRLFRARWFEISGKGQVSETKFFRDWNLVNLTARASTAVKAANQLIRDLVADLGRVSRGKCETVCPPIPTQGGQSLRNVAQATFILTQAERLRLFMFDDLARHRVFVLPHLLSEADIGPVLEQLKRQLLVGLPKAHELMGTKEFWKDFVEVDAIESAEHVEMGEAIRLQIYRSPEMRSSLLRDSGLPPAVLDRHFCNGVLREQSAKAAPQNRLEFEKVKARIGSILRTVNQRERSTTKRRVEFMRSLVGATFPRPDFAILLAQPQHKQRRNC